MSATNQLRADHDQVKRLEKIVFKCSDELKQGTDIPFSDLTKITIVISEFVDTIHHSREEDFYFPCVASHESLKDEIHRFLVEHEFGRNVARLISRHLKLWKTGSDEREPVSRYLKAYGVFLKDHLHKENKFFDDAEAQVLTKQEESEMYEEYKSVFAIVKKAEDMILEIDSLESCSWYQK
ncbi:hemerythrin domain-containing protein [Nitrosopumilus sp.]|uniref:hemerythrin domain-containing protein n=1 Tax=Nitrosopumilus sp. TaxID=2024843 RepID=UPI00247EA429|nr:hemerythrin domain-containing protein [Nitrosopumilus sp.]MCV0431685.1 hemerythrin domain-containing protein [Nitrosopumilus sp.]